MNSTASNRNIKDLELLPDLTGSDDTLLPLPGTVPASAGVPAPAPAPAFSSDSEIPVAESGELADSEAVSAPPRGGKAASKPRAGKAAKSGDSDPTSEEIGYRFPLGRVAIEPIPDTTGAFGAVGTFSLRAVWHRGKAVIPVFESTALRPVALVTLGGERYPVFLSQHSRKKRERIMLGGKRKTAKSPRCALRFVLRVEGREDRLSWYWRIAATSAAIEAAPASNTNNIPDEVTLFLPFAPGKARVITMPGVTRTYALWINDLVATVGLGEVEGYRDGSPAATLGHEERSFYLSMPGADLSGKGVSLHWETWFAAARTETEARAALLRHAADIGQRMQKPPAPEDYPHLTGELLRLIQAGEQILMSDKLVDKRGAEKQIYRAEPGQTALHVAGEGTDTALAAAALLTRFSQTGDDLLRRRARLLSYGVCEYQVNIEESPHWGAIWDALYNKKVFADLQGEATLSVTTTARAAKGLFVCNAHFDKELLQRTALAATQWLLLKMDRDGFIPATRFHEVGPPVDGTSSAWIMCEAMIPLMETFRSTQNEVFLKAAQRILAAVQTGVSNATLSLQDASCEQLAAAVEGILMISREYESEEMIATARQIMLGLKVRRQPDGSLLEPPGATASTPLSSTLYAVRAALALTRVDLDPQWIIFALRGLRAASRQAATTVAGGGRIGIADATQLMMNALGILLAVAQRVAGTEADRDRLTLKKGWQTFGPDPATREYIRVTGLNEEPVDYLALVCPVSMQVLISVVAPPDMTEVLIIKNGRRPYIKNWLNGDFDTRARLEPLGDGTEAMIGVFLADT